MEKEELNFNYSECIKGYDSWGETTYVNICNKSRETIPWGIDGYFAFFGVILLFLLGITMIISFVRMIIDN